VKCQRLAHTVPENLTHSARGSHIYIREERGASATGGTPAYIRDGHNTKKYDCEIYDKRIKDRWKREV
jgi:hypothetical protein